MGEGLKRAKKAAEATRGKTTSQPNTAFPAYLAHLLDTCEMAKELARIEAEHAADPF